MAEPKQDTTDQSTEESKPKQRKQSSAPAVKSLENKITGELASLQQQVNDLQESLDLSNQVVVCLLLKNCRDLGGLGYEKKIRSFWSTTGGMVVDEDLYALQQVIKDTESKDVLGLFMENLMEKTYNQR